MKRLMIVGLSLFALTVSGCCCGQGLCGGGCGGGCGACGSNYPSYQGAYAAPMGGSCGCQ